MEKTYEQQVGELLDELFKLQKETGMDFSEWSKVSGISKKRIENFSKREELPTLALLIRLAHALGYNIRLNNQKGEQS